MVFESEALIHLDALGCFALRLAGNELDAQDLVQECLERAWKGFALYRPGTRCKSWLFKILHNSYKMRLRSACMRREVPTEYPERSLTRIASPSAEFQYLSGRLNRELTTSIRSLSSQQKQVLFLSECLGLEYAEIARSVGIKIGTVRSCLHRVKKRVRQLCQQSP